MKKESASFEYESYEAPEDLPATDRDLFRRAVEAAASAYAPYSQFRVGAALRLDDGTVITGSNQENAAYPSGLCAERVALFHAGAAHPGKKVTALAVAAFAANEKRPRPATPCGDCRQVMVETERRHGRPMRIVALAGENRCIAVPSAASLLPFAFGSGHLHGGGR
jgi:cytidine deaminase